LKKQCHLQLLGFIDRKAFMENTWCGVCDEENNVGIFGPAEFEIDAKKLPQGFYRKYGTRIISEIIDKTLEE
jgi:hypothetical protein